MADRRYSFGSSLEDPPNSRLFIIGSKQLTEDDFRSAFEDYGTIEEIWILRDRSTGESKGITYIKFSRTSEAARAMEAMNGRCIGSTSRSIRVMIAASREQGSRRESNEEEKIQRLFVIVPKTMTDVDLYDTFKIYGDIDYATVMRDRETRESKGFGYIKYFKFSHAALAFEQCDRKFKAVFAEPRKSNSSRTEEKYAAPRTSSKFNTQSLFLPDDQSAARGGYTKLLAIVSPLVNQDQLWKLFDIVPGLDYCQLRLEGRPRPNRGIASIVYNTAQSAAHAREKIHGFEYPPGNRIIVKPDFEGAAKHDAGGSHLERHNKADIMQIAETIAQATNLIQAAGLSPDILQVKLGLPSSSTTKEDPLCSVSLPEPQPLAGIDDETASRCFIVCTPSPLPNTVLKDIFCRFGNLIDVYMLNNRNCGFAKFATRESAENAMRTLHGADIQGIRIKVLEAEERQDQNNRKRQRVEDKF